MTKTREIISIQVGQCGNQIGRRFWESVCEEHGLDLTGILQEGTREAQLERIPVYFRESLTDERLVPRSVSVDLDPVSCRSCGGLFDPRNFATASRTRECGTYASGFYGTPGSVLASNAIDIIRREAEACDFIQGFQILHSLGGGTGSGTTSMILTDLKDEFPDCSVLTFSVLPSHLVSETVVEAYNAILATRNLVEMADQVVAIDNSALFRLCCSDTQSSPTYDELNSVVSPILSNVTCSFRFPASRLDNLHKLGVNLVPYPRLHFYTICTSPLFQGEDVSLVGLTQQIFDARNSVVEADVRRGRELAGMAIFRGRGILDGQRRTNASFLKTINSTTVDFPPKGFERSASFIGNYPSVREVFRRIANAFSSLFSRRAFLYWYVGDGTSGLMDECEFIEAESCVRELIAEYQEKEE